MYERMPSVRNDVVDVSVTPIVDVRRAAHRDQIRGAVRYDPEALLESDHPHLPFARGRRAVVYGDSEELVEAVVAKLRHDGFDAAALEGGIESWRDNGLPTEDLSELCAIDASA
jgi:rhodanese-related sulfurtransferase